MYVRTYHRPAGVAYYRCRACDQEGSCGAPSVREDALLPWGQELVERLDALRPADFGAKLDRRRSANRVTENAIASIDRLLDRVRDLYEMGDRTREYIQRRDQLLDQRITRQHLLGELFDAIYVEDGQVTGVKPRTDRAGEVADLLDQHEAQPAGIRSRSGEGGI